MLSSIDLAKFRPFTDKAEYAIQRIQGGWHDTVLLDLTLEPESLLKRLYPKFMKVKFGHTDRKILNEIGPGVEKLLTDMESLDVEDGYADLVAIRGCNFSENLIKELYRATRTKGYLLIYMEDQDRGELSSRRSTSLRDMFVNEGYREIGFVAHDVIKKNKLLSMIGLNLVEKAKYATALYQKPQ